MMKKKRNWSLKEQADFLKKVGELIDRGYPLSEAIHSLTYQMKRHQKEEIDVSLKDLKEGHPFHKILVDMGFNKTLIGFVYFAEQHGSLADAFRDGSEMMLKREGDAQKLKKLLFYPVVLLFLTLFLFVFVEQVILPQYTFLFTSMNLSPNFFMKLVYVIGKLFPFIFLLFLLLLIFALYYYSMKFRRYTPLKRRSLLTTLPIFGPYFRLLTTHYFSIQLSYLLKGGLSILEALKLFEQNMKHSFDRQLGKEIQEQLSKGEAFEGILRQYPFFERELPFIVKHGHENGKIEEELLFFSKYCVSKLESKMEKSFKVIQPILYSMIGVIIVSLYLAILLPMFQLLDGI